MLEDVLVVELGLLLDVDGLHKLGHDVGHEPERTSALRPDATFSETRIFSNSSLLRSAEMLSQPALLRIASSRSCVMAKGFSGRVRVVSKRTARSILKGSSRILSEDRRRPDHTPLQIFAALERVYDLTRERIGGDGIDREVPACQIFSQTISEPYCGMPAPPGVLVGPVVVI